MLASVHEDLAVRVNGSLIEDEHVGRVERVVLHEAPRISTRRARHAHRQAPGMGIPFRPRLGDRSFTRHLAMAADLEVSVAICYSPGLGFDLDIPEDLETYQHMEPGLLDRLAPQ